MITNPHAIGAVYDSDIHCITCAELRFGQSLYDRKPPDDSERNPPGLLFNYSYEAPAEGTYCGTCHSEISPPDGHALADERQAQASAEWQHVIDDFHALASAEWQHAIGDFHALVVSSGENLTWQDFQIARENLMRACAKLAAVFSAKD